MAVMLTAKAMEESTYVITASFTDEAGDAATPKTLTWTLTDPDGVVVNNREDVIVSPLGESVTILLTGDDLALTGYLTRTRHLTLEGTYDGSLGSDLPFTGVIIFSIEPAVAVGD